MSIGVCYLACPDCTNVLFELNGDGECHCPVCGADFPMEAATSLFKEVTTPATVEIFDDRQHVQTVFRPDMPKFYGAANAVAAPVNLELPLPETQLKEIELEVAAFLESHWNSYKQEDGIYRIPINKLQDVRMVIPWSLVMGDILLAEEPHKKLESVMYEELSNQVDMAILELVAQIHKVLEEKWGSELSEAETFALSEACGRMVSIYLPLDEALTKKYPFTYNERGLLTGVREHGGKTVVITLEEAIARNKKSKEKKKA